MRDRRRRERWWFLVVHLHVLSLGGWSLGPPERIRLPISASGPPPKYGYQPIMLGHEPARDVFVTWPVRPRLPAERETAAEIPVAVLDEARRLGIAVWWSGGAVVAFRPDHIRDYFEGFVAESEAERGPQMVAGSPPLPPARTARRPRRFRLPWPQLKGRLPRARRTQSTRFPGGAEIQLDKLQPAEPPADRDVETGLARADRPGEPLNRFTPLEPDSPYLFFFAVGAGTGASIETDPEPLPDDLPDQARLTVQLFPFDGELELTGPTRGAIEVSVTEGVRIVELAGAVDSEELNRERLFFPIRTPADTGMHRLRCNLYHGSTLLQSRLVTCRVGGEPDVVRPALTSQPDYSISVGLSLADLAQAPAHDLSLMINGGAPGLAPTHQFRFYRDGEELLVEDASLDSAALEEAIAAARGALRHASWGSEGEWTKGRKYLYETPVERGRLERDLIELAIRGHRLYIDITGGLKNGYAARQALREAMAGAPGRIQIAAAAGLYVPAALFYDHPLETAPSARGRKELAICAAFATALEDGSPLAELPCFAAECPDRDDSGIVCPGGFWGYRHEIGWPVEAERSIAEVPVGDSPRIAIGVCTDPDLHRRVEHSTAVLALGRGAIAESRDAFRDLLKESVPHLVYLYCHGGITAGGRTPYVVLGPADSNGIDAAWLVDQEIRWEEPPPRPLVFINGCRTTAVEPRQLMNLVRGFVGDANAIGVVGTEITVFEPLACAFAEDMLPGFLSGDGTIGGAVRRARLELLRARNPLGLVYIPFVAADTRLVPA